MKNCFLSAVCVLAIVGFVCPTIVLGGEIKTVRGELSYGASAGGSTSVTDSSGQGIIVPNSSENAQLILQGCQQQMQLCEVTYSRDKKGNVKVLKVRKID